MADKLGYVKLDRNMLEWRWISTPNTAHLFVVILLKANYKDMDFEDLKVRRGQLVTSIQSLSKISGLSVQQTRTALNHLKSTGELTVRLYPRYQVITVVNYNSYQELTGTLTGKQQGSNRVATGYQQQEKDKKEGNTRKKEIKGRSAPVSPPGKKSLPDRDKGTVGDIPEKYRGQFKTYAEFWDWRYQ